MDTETQQAIKNLIAYYISNIKIPVKKDDVDRAQKLAETVNLFHRATTQEYTKTIVREVGEFYSNYYIDIAAANPHTGKHVSQYHEP